MSHAFDTTYTHGGCARSSRSRIEAARFAAQLVARPICQALAFGLALVAMGFCAIWLPAHCGDAAFEQFALA